MEIRQRYLSALLLSASAHGLVLFVAHQGGGGGVERASSAAPAPAGALAVRLARSAPGAQLPVPPASAAAGNTSPAPPPAPSDPVTLPASPAFELPIPAQAGIRYFDVHELTQEPLHDDGLIGGTFLVLPGITAQNIVVTVSIDDLGYVARIEFDQADLSADEERRVRQAFSKVRFLPGKIGRIAVRSQLKMQIMLDTEMRY